MGGEALRYAAGEQWLAAVGLFLEEAFELATHGAVALAQRGEVVGDVGDVIGGDCGAFGNVGAAR